MTEPAFTIHEPKEVFLVEVTKEGHGGIWRFYGKKREEALSRASAFVDGQLEKHHKSVAARYARARGRTLQALSAANGAEKA